MFKKKPLDAEKKSMKNADVVYDVIDYAPINFCAPVASHDPIRIFISSTVVQKSFLEGIDVQNTYLYDGFDIPIIMEQPTDHSHFQAKLRFCTG